MSALAFRRLFVFVAEIAAVLSFNRSFCVCSGNTAHNSGRVPLRQSNLSIRPASDADVPIAHAGALEIATFFTIKS